MPARMLLIACGYEDADDLDHLRTIQASSWPVDDCPIAGTIYARNRPCHVGRMLPACAKPSAYITLLSIDITSLGGIFLWRLASVQTEPERRAVQLSGRR
jgi:hypothetical protein